MARDMAPAAGLAKWIGAPVVLALAGYFVIGPMLGHMGKHLPKQVEPLVAEAGKEIPVLKRPEAKPPKGESTDAPATDENKADEPSVQVSQKPAEKPSSSTSSSTDSGPDVEVTVQSASDPAPATTVAHRRRHAKKAHHTTPKPKPADPAATDPASFGGTQDGGTTPPPADGN